MSIVRNRWLTTFTAAGGIYQYRDVITTPDTLTAHFEFDRLPVVWRHRLWGATEFAPETNNGVFLYGEEATIFASDQKWIVIPNRNGAEPEELETASNAELLSSRGLSHKSVELQQSTSDENQALEPGFLALAFARKKEQGEILRH